jgi:hypothetical protein
MTTSSVWSRTQRSAEDPQGVLKIALRDLEVLEDLEVLQIKLSIAFAAERYS